MIPAVFDGSAPPGEAIVYDTLHRHPESADWTVLHSFDLPNHVKNLQGEIDFVVIVPGLGIVCLEVKSHTKVERTADGMWLLGSDPPQPRGPFKQASEAAFSLIDYVKNHAQGLLHVPIISVVCFPRCTFDVPATEWEEWQAIDAADLQRHSLPYLLSASLHQAREKFTRQGKPHDKGTPTDAEVEALVRTLRPRFEVHQSPKARAAALAQELKRYTQEQSAVLDMCDVNKRVFIQGGGRHRKKPISDRAGKTSSCRRGSCSPRVLQPAARHLDQERVRGRRDRNSLVNDARSNAGGRRSPPALQRDRPVLES